MYDADLCVQGEPLQSVPAPLTQVDELEAGAGAEEDLDEDDGEVVGTPDSSVGVNEDPSLAEGPQEGPGCRRAAGRCRYPRGAFGYGPKRVTDVEGGRLRQLYLSFLTHSLTL